jgi:hypothetical protein
MLVESKSNLARLMATENLIVEQRQVPTAFFDIKNRVLTVPVLNGNLSNEVIDLLLGHEVGHALETPAQGWHDSVVDLKVNRSILNVCEDARIEKKIKRKFPGIRISFVKGYRELLEMDFFGTKDKDINKLNFIDRVNLYTKGGAAQGIDFTSEEYSLVREVEDAETFEETVAIAMKIQKFMKEQPQKQKSKPQKVEPGEEMTPEIGNTMPNDFDFDSGEDQEEGVSKAKEGDTKEENGETQSSGDTKETEQDELSDKPETPQTGETGNAGSKDVKIESETDNAFREKEKELYSSVKNRKDVMYSNIPEILLENVIVDHKTLIKEIESYNADPFRREWFREDKMRANFSKFRTESNKVVSYLVKEFEMRKNAEQQTRAKVSKTGELNLTKIHEYKFTDDIFARMTKVPNGKSHGLVMFIDWSGSMCDHMSPTIKQLLNLVMFCKKVNIPFDVYAFTTCTFVEYPETLEVQKLKVGDLNVHSFSLLNILSHKMSANEFTKMASYLLDYGTGRRGTCSNMEPPEILQLGGTPLNEAVISAFKVIPKFKTENKLQIVNTVFLTDGEGSSLYGRIDAINGRNYESTPVDPNWKMRSFFRDPITKASAEVMEGSCYGSRGSAQTTALLKLLKQRTDANVIGFYIAKVRDVRQALVLYSPKSEETKIDSRVTEFRKNNFTYLNNVGYDEYYFIRSDKLDTDEDDEFEVTSTTTRSLVSAFSKYTGNRVSNRIVLNRFINLIA